MRISRLISQEFHSIQHVKSTCHISPFVGRWTMQFHTSQNCNNKESSMIWRLKTPKASKQRKRPQRASFLSRIQTYKAWKQENFKPNHQLYLEYLHYCVEEAYEHPERSLQTAEALLQDMKLYNLTPDIEIYNRYLQCAVRGKNLEKASEIFQMIEGSGVQPSQITFGAMMRVHALHDQKENARKYFDEMVKRNMLRGDLLNFDDIFYGLQTL